MGVETAEQSLVLRPAAVLEYRSAIRVLGELERLDVSRGGVWNATSSLWQRFDQPWNGPGGSRGDAELLGSIGVMYDAPSRHQITVYRVTLTAAGAHHGWTIDAICDDALAWGGLTLRSCPRAELRVPPGVDPFTRSEELLSKHRAERDHRSRERTRD
jgi:hypothetical protein